MNDKVRHVLGQGQTRQHHCHWPGCTRQVPPARFSCRPHWYSLPIDLRNAIWKAYRPGQERDGRPSPEYIAAARAVQEWIAREHPPAAPAPEQGTLL